MVYCFFVALLDFIYGIYIFSNKNFSLQNKTVAIRCYDVVVVFWLWRFGTFDYFSHNLFHPIFYKENDEFAYSVPGKQKHGRLCFRKSLSVQDFFDSESTTVESTTPLKDMIIFSTLPKTPLVPNEMIIFLQKLFSFPSNFYK